MPTPDVSSQPSASSDAAFHLDDGAIRKALQRTSLLICAVVAIAVAWSVLTPVDELARAHGAMAPAGRMQQVDARDGGLVTEILVKEGGQVKRGDPILRFDRVRSRSELATAEAKRASLELQVERHSAFIDDREPDLSKLSAEYPVVASREQAALVAQRALLKADTQIIRQQATEKSAQLAALELQIPAIEEEQQAIRSSLDIISGLADRGLASRIRQSELIERRAKADRELAEARGQKALIEAQIVELNQSIETRRSRGIAEASEKRAEAAGQLRVASEEITNLKDRVESATVTAPVDGTVQALLKPRVGLVAAPGEVVAEIVPSGEALVFDAQLSPRDVGFVRPGQATRVKLDAFDFSRFGAVAGVVESVSATTVADPKGQPFYRLIIRLNDQHLPRREDLKAQAGMTGEADVRTGARTVFQYIWKPVYTNLDLALSER